jgi:hypothetical protein
MTSSGPARDLDVYEIAFLAGGPDRVVDAAVVALVESGRVRVHAPGQLAVVDPTRRHPVEAALLDAVGTRGHRSVDTIRWRCGRDERLTGLGRSLAAAGLLRRALRGRAGWSATRTGRTTLRRLTAQPPADRALDGGSAVLVALRGREAMTDSALRAAIFDRPALPEATGPGLGRRLREARRLRESEDPHLAAHQTRAALGSAAAFGFIEGGGGDGGGF